MKITFIVGLPGSGKTHLGNQMAEDDENIVYLDDISLQQDPITNLKMLMGVQHIVISDVFLCRKNDRKKAVELINQLSKEEGFEYFLEWIFFENNPDKCLKNVVFRDDNRKVDNLIHQLTKIYEIPVGVESKEITIAENLLSRAEKVLELSAKWWGLQDFRRTNDKI